MRVLPEILSKEKPKEKALTLLEAFNHIRTVKPGFQNLDRKHTIVLMNSLSSPPYSLNVPYECYGKASDYLLEIENKVSNF